MRQVRFFLVLAALTCFAATSIAADPSTEAVKRPRSTADVVKAFVKAPALTGAAGDEVAFVVHLDIADTWHLYDHRYAEDPESFFIGVDLMPAEGANLAGFAVKFPVGDAGEFMGEKVVMLHHAADIEVTVTLPQDAKGVVSVPLTVTAQACDDKICLQPSDIDVVARITVE